MESLKYFGINKKINVKNKYLKRLISETCLKCMSFSSDTPCILDVKPIKERLYNSYGNVYICKHYENKFFLECLMNWQDELMEMSRGSKVYTFEIVVTVVLLLAVAVLAVV